MFVSDHRQRQSLPYFAAVLFYHSPPSCCLWQALPPFRSTRSLHGFHPFSSPRRALFPFSSHPPASCMSYLRLAVLSFFADLHPDAWCAPSLFAAVPSPGLCLDLRHAPWTPSARVHPFCVKHKSCSCILFEVRNELKKKKKTYFTNFLPRSSLLSMFGRLLWSSLPMDLSSLFGFSGFLTFSLGLSGSASSHLSGFFRSYIVENEEKKTLRDIGNNALVWTGSNLTHLNFWFFFSLVLVFVQRFFKSLHLFCFFALPSLFLPPLTTLLIPQTFAF